MTHDEIIALARAKKAEMDAKSDKLDRIRELVEGLSSPTLAKLKTFLSSIKEILG